MAYLVESLTTGELSVAKPTFSSTKAKLFGDLVVSIPTIRTSAGFTEYQVQSCLPHGVIGLGCINTVWKRFKQFKQFHARLKACFVQSAVEVLLFCRKTAFTYLFACNET